MRWRRSGQFIGSAVLVGVLAASAWADTELVRQGAPAPFDGLLFDQAAATQVVEDVRDAETLRAQVETLQAEAATLRTQVSDLQAALDKQQQALAVADERDKMREALEGRMLRAMDTQERALESALKAGQLALQAADRAAQLTEAANKRADRNATLGFWGGLLALVVGVFTGGFAP